MRRGELLGLRWQDVELEAGRLSIRQSLVASGKYEPRFEEPKTDRGRRSIPLPPEATATLRSWRAQQAQERLQWGPAWTDSGLLFTREDGTPLHPDRFSKLFGRHVRAVGLPRIRLHDLRHTFATLALCAGVPAKVVSEILGHASIAITLDVYSHAVPALQEDATARVAGLVSEVPSSTGRHLQESRAPRGDVTCLSDWGRCDGEQLPRLGYRPRSTRTIENGAGRSLSHQPH